MSWLSGTLEFRSIAEPLRSSVGRVRYQKGKARAIDPVRKRLLLRSDLAGVPDIDAANTEAADDHRAAAGRAESNPAMKVPVVDAIHGVRDLAGTVMAPVDFRWQELEYDSLVVGVGARNNTFNIPGVENNPNVKFLKELSDARNIRRHVLRSFDEASLAATSDAEKRRLLSFVVVGGGPTGVEFAAELHDLIHEDLRKFYPELMQYVSLKIISGLSILGGFDEALRQFAIGSFKRQHIDVLTGANVKQVNTETIDLTDDTAIPYGMIMWATGLAPRKLVKRLRPEVMEFDPWGHIVVDDHLRAVAPKQSEARIGGLYAIGDCCSVQGHGYAATAQVAEQQGRYLAGKFNESWDGNGASADGAGFEYKHAGTLAYIGSKGALGDFTQAKADIVKPLQGSTLSGLAAWFTWRSVYLTKQGAWRNRLQVPMDWARSLVFGRDISQF